jgi:hypothetical protein
MYNAMLAKLEINERRLGSNLSSLCDFLMKFLINFYLTTSPIYGIIITEAREQ